MQSLPHHKEHRITRRRFVKRGTAGVMTAALWRKSHGANDRIGIGMIGYGLIGQSHLTDFKEQPDVDMVAISEAHRGRMEQAAELMGGQVARYRDFRNMLENKDVDAVVISTPDHWHALHTMLACAAGKDVYVEKPLTLFVREGRWMVNVANKYKRVVQVGTQQRSGLHYQQAREFIQSGKLGKIVTVRADFHRNLMPGFGNPPDQDPPADLDWNMFLGPAPLKPYNPNRGIYQFRWFWDYSGGQMTNWGQHSLDIVHWIMDVEGPSRIFSTGGRKFLQDNCEVPDIQDSIWEYPGWTYTNSIRECSLGEGSDPLGFFGTKGSLLITRSGYRVTPDVIMPAIDLMPGVKEGHPVGGPQYVSVSPRRKLRTVREKKTNPSPRNLLKLHARNFLDCIKSRNTPISDIESGHRIATSLHLANLSLRLGRPLQWDVESETILDDKQANEMLERPYRKPWDTELKSLEVT